MVVEKPFPKAKSRDLATGVLDDESLAQSWPLLIRLLSFALLLMTLFGSLVPILGGWAVVKTLIVWPLVLTPAHWVRIGVAIIFQILVSWGQYAAKSAALQAWAERDVPSAAGRWLFYLLALLVSATPSAYTYGTWVQLALAQLGPLWLGWTLIAGGCMIIDIIPEWVLIRKRK